MVISTETIVEGPWQTDLINFFLKKGTQEASSGNLFLVVGASKAKVRLNYFLHLCKDRQN